MNGQGRAHGTPGGIAGARIVVTGAASGIGRVTCLRLAELGAHPVAVDRDGAGLEALGELVSDARITICSADLADEASGDRIRDAAGRSVSGLVNCAAIVSPSALLDQRLDGWDEVFCVNLRAPMLLTQLLAAEMIRAGMRGSIVNISSTAAAVARPGLAAYAASKAALEQLTKVQAIELAPHGLRANCVRVGLIDTEGVRAAAATPAAAAEHAGKIARIPFNRPGNSAEVAEMVVFLLSDASSYCTGGIFTVDGGYSAGIALPQ